MEMRESARTREEILLRGDDVNAALDSASTFSVPALLSNNSESVVEALRSDNVEVLLPEKFRLSGCLVMLAAIASLIDYR